MLFRSSLNSWAPYMRVIEGGANDIAYNGRLYYLDGSHGSCDSGYTLGSQSDLDAIIGANANAWNGLDYKHTITNYCCVWTSDSPTLGVPYGMPDPAHLNAVGYCDGAGPFAASPTTSSGWPFDCNSSNNVKKQTKQLTLCASNAAHITLTSPAAPYDFGNVGNGMTSAPVTFTLKNDGQLTLNISSITATGNFTPSAPASSTLAAGTSTTFTATFKPSGLGLQNGTLVVNSSDLGANAPYSISVKGTGVTPPTVSISSPALNNNTYDFGNVRVGVGKTVSFTVKNTGGADLVITNITTAAPFSLTNLPAFNKTLTANQTVTFDVTYTPSGEVLQSQVLHILSNDPNNPDYSPLLKGTGIAPHLAYLDAGTVITSHNYGDRLIGSQANYTFQIKNTGTADLKILSMSAGNNQFTIVSPTVFPVMVTPAMSTDVTIAFVPSGALGAKSSTLIVNADAANPPNNLDLSGNEIAPQVSVPGSKDLGSVAFGDTGPEVTIDATNIGKANLTLSQPTITGPQAGDFLLVSFNASAPPNVASHYILKCKPTGGGTRSATLNVLSDARKDDGSSDSPKTVALTCTGLAPKLTAADLDCGSVNVSKSTVTQLKLTNDGTQPLSVNQLVFSNAEFSSTATLPINLSVGGSQNVPITFKPAAVGDRSATLVISSTDPTSPKTIKLTGKGTSPMVAFAMSTLDFGNVVLGASKALNVTVNNTGTGPLTITSVSLGGANATAFMTNVSGSVTIDPGKSLSGMITFTPKTVGSASATFDVLCDDPSLPNMKATAQLTGNGTSGMISVAPSALAFGGQLVGRTSPARTVTLTNTGKAPLKISQVMVTGNSAADFAITSPAIQGPLAPQATATVSLTLKPKTVGMEMAELEIQSDDPGKPSVVIQLTGMGVSQLLAVSPMTVDFGSVRAGLAGPTKSVAISNTSGDPIMLLEATLGGMGKDAYKLVDSAVGTLQAGETKMLSVSFKPPLAGQQPGTLTIASSDNTLPTAVVMLSGQGLSDAITVADPRELDFGAVTVGMPKTQTITLTNISAGPITLMSVLSNNSTLFNVSGVDTTTPIPAGGTAKIAATFAPVLAGKATAALTIQLLGTAGAEGMMLLLTGTGVAAESPGGCSIGLRPTGSSALALLALLCVAVAVRRRAAGL